MKHLHALKSLPVADNIKYEVKPNMRIRVLDQDVIRKGSISKTCFSTELRKILTGTSPRQSRGR